MRVSVELVPRGEAEVLADATVVKSVMAEANTFNIPDLTRFSLRSWQACTICSKVLSASIPHIRAIDIPPGDELPMGEEIVSAGLTEVLVIQGDHPNDPNHQTYPNTSEDIIRLFKRRHPELRVYAGFDPYRNGVQAEMTRVSSKLDAGADGFFTQPIFDLRLLETCAELLRGQSVFWGIAPVLGERSRAYWEKTNLVEFPPEFEPTLDWNRAFAISAVKEIRALGSNVYFMPIRVDLAQYLQGLV